MSNPTIRVTIMEVLLHETSYICQKLPKKKKIQTLEQKGAKQTPN